MTSDDMRMNGVFGKVKQYFRELQNPNIYHGFERKGPYFEGWFYKLVDKAGKQRWLIIPGVYIGADKKDSHSFIQVLDSVQGKTHYIN